MRDIRVFENTFLLPLASESLVNSKDIIVDDKDLEELQASNSTKDTNT